MSKIFISYVRDDSEADAGRLSDTLVRELPGATFFLDSRDIEYGQNWKRVVERSIEGSAVVLLVMGPRWKLSPAIELELALAFRSDVSVIPLLFRGAGLVSLTEELPPSAAELKDRNALSIDHSAWERDVAPLLSLLRKVIADPARARVIIDPPDPRRLLETHPSNESANDLLNYARDLAECLNDEQVYVDAVAAAERFEEELVAKRETDREYSRLWGAYQSVRGQDPELVRIVKDGRRRLEIEQKALDLLTSSDYEGLARFLDDESLVPRIRRLDEEFEEAVAELKSGGNPFCGPKELKEEKAQILEDARKRLRAELPDFAKRHPDFKWP